MRLLIRFWRWLRTPSVDHVSAEWLYDERRRSSGRGIDQSTTTWPWSAGRR